MQPTTTTPRRIERWRLAWLRPGVLWFAFDLIVPTALLYIVIWRGGSLYLALLASAALSAVTAVIAYRGESRGQRFAPVMLALALASLGVALVTGSDRFLLAKESVLTAVMGLWFLGSLWSERPLTYRFTRPLLESRWGRRWSLPETSWERVWEREPRFRHIWRVSTVMWGIATLTDAVLRVVIAYTLPIPSVPAAQVGLMIATVVIMQPITHVYYARAGLWRLLWEAGERDADRPVASGS